MKKENIGRFFKCAEMILNGNTFEKAGAEAGFTGTRARQVYAQVMRRARRGLLLNASTPGDFPIQVARENKEFWLERINNVKNDLLKKRSEK